jgi:hypothetical protein
VSYAVRTTAAVVGSLSRLDGRRPPGAHLVHVAIRGLAADPRPDHARLLNEAESLYLLPLSRVDPVTQRTLRYQVVYQVRDGDLVVVVVTAAAVPRNESAPVACPGAS